MRRPYQQIIAGLVCAVCVSVAGESILRGETDDAARPIKTVIEQKFPGMKVLRVSKTEIPGWLLVRATVTERKTKRTHERLGGTCSPGHSSIFRWAGM